jgi:aspartyl-tRNA synthetase
MSDSAPRLLRRTHGCGSVTPEQAAQQEEVILTGWVHRRRDLGQLIFLEIRDNTGSVQVVFDPSDSPAAHAAAESLRIESVVGIGGKVVAREAPNPQHPTGMVEVRAAELVVHNLAESIPFTVAEDVEANEEARLTHRYIDLRRHKLQSNLRTRHRLSVAARRVLDGSGFIEMETPILTRSTPEGARDYLVPSRLHPGSFYALPQSPQLFKQLLMVAGFDRYYQFARCFRDEDLRADRQPEFTQIDIEMSFVEPQDVYAVVESLMVEMFREIGVEVATPFRRMAYSEAMERFGSDKPDTRFALELRCGGEAAKGSGFQVFDSALQSGGAVRGIAVPGGGSASRKQLDRWASWAREAGAKGLVWIKIADGGVTSSALKVLGEGRCRSLAEAVEAGEGDAALLMADSLENCNRVLGILRLRIAEELALVPSDKWHLLWIEGFPLLEWDQGEKRWFAMHHPFTAPHWDEVDLLEERPADTKSQAYDIVLNGTEIGGGSIRIHRRDVQERVFKVMQIGEEEALAKFGFLLRALEAGAPPHGGIALGFDRICAMLCGTDSIREVIAFPKSTSASCLMTRSPAEVDEEQLRELHLALRSRS